MKNFHETTDGLIIPYSKVSMMKDSYEGQPYIRVVFDNGNEENLDDEEKKIIPKYKAWLDVIHLNDHVIVNSHVNDMTDGSERQFTEFSKKLVELVTYP